MVGVTLQLLAVGLVLSTSMCPVAISKTLEETQKQVADLQAKMDEREDRINMLTNQMLVQEFESRQRIRIEGDSGIAQVHNFEVGTHDYHSFSHIGMAAGSMHDHAGTEDAVGWGKFTAVLNGVQFTTRHNDPKMRRASRTSSEWMATEKLEFPGVPPSVLAKDTLEDQIKEMQEYYRAFKLQDKSIRDYTNYFVPVVAYLEGMWLKDITKVETLFESLKYRYFADGYYDKMRDEDRFENLLGGIYRNEGRTADLPRSMLGINETTGEPIWGQWNYRIMFHPISREIPTTYFHAKGEQLFHQMYPEAPSDPALSRGAVFILDDQETIGRREGKTLLDEIAEEIPGLNNVGTLLEGDFGVQMKDLTNTNENVNLAFYNRRYYSQNRYYVVRQDRVRGYADANMFVALNTQEKVAPFHFVLPSSSGPTDVRASYMIPLEIIYLHPIQRWNPYNMTNDNQYVPKAGRGSQSEPYQGFAESRYYTVPLDFFEWRYTVPYKTKADDFYTHLYYLDSAGATVKCAASGIFTITPSIANGVGNVRLRYPIFPVHFEGSGEWKALNAFKAYLSTQLKGVANTMEGQ